MTGTFEGIHFRWRRNTGDMNSEFFKEIRLTNLSRDFATKIFSLKKLYKYSPAFCEQQRRKLSGPSIFPPW